jgi:hypothetical protein
LTIILRKKFIKLVDKQVTVDAKGILAEFYRKVGQAEKLIHEDVNIQSSIFQMKRKDFKSNCDFRHKSITIFNTSKKPLSKVKHLKKFSLTDEKFKPRIKNSFQDLMYTVIKNNSINNEVTDKKQIKKGKKKALSITQVFEDFLKKFHCIYFKGVSEFICNSAIDVINKDYIARIAMHFKIQDQIEELLYLYNEDPSNFSLTIDSNYQKSIDLMINQLELERENNLIEFSTEKQQKLSKITAKNESFGFEQSKSFSEITEDLIRSLINIFNN